MRGIVRGLLAAAVGLAVVAGVGGVVAYDWLLAPAGPSTKAQLFVVKPGASVASLGQELEARHLIRNDQAFRLYLRLGGLDREIKAGAYALAPAMGVRGIAKQLVAGRDERTRVTVPEGYAISQIAKRLGAGRGERFAVLAAKAAPFRAEFKWLPAQGSLEGYLFPDTYVVAEGTDAEASLIRLMLTRFEQVGLVAYRKHGAPHGLSLSAWVTMASIVEKEARQGAERALIAGVFYNRLASRIPLGSDPTVEYALGRHQDARGLTFADVRIDSPYNTYRYPGLPPGPIASPGLAALLASLQPANTPFLYFVAKGDGSHVFTKTYAEHLAAQREIVRAMRQRPPT